MTMDTAILEAVAAHYRRFFGAYDESIDLRDPRGHLPDFRIRSWKVRKGKTRVYGTLGNSSAAYAEMPFAHRVEFVFPVRESESDISLAERILGAACAVPRGTAGEVGGGHTIQLSEPLEGTGGKRRLLVSPSFAESEEFQTLVLEDLHIDFLMLVPIFESEFAYLRRYGEAEFWQALAADDVDFTDIARGPLRVT